MKYIDYCNMIYIYISFPFPVFDEVTGTIIRD